MPSEIVANMRCHSPSNASWQITLPKDRGGAFEDSVSSLPLLKRGLLRWRSISWELSDAWDLPGPTTRLADMSAPQLQVLSWLEAHRAAIVDVEWRRRVDRRAIAAAIAWEALENARWPFSRRAGGVGKVHTNAPVVQQAEAAGYLPRRNYRARKKLLRNADDAIEYIGAIMQAIADIADDFNWDIRCRIDILTNEYQGRDLEQWRKWLAAKMPGSALVPANPMALWARDNASYVELAVGTPDLAIFVLR
ncbi:MAG TPA: hypothetical protein VJ757_06005 [Pseudonocardiaceae bacterium]|nr:hypothetical protein [Pseudonocardiaceae bacterium]